MFSNVFTAGFNRRAPKVGLARATLAFASVALLLGGCAGRNDYNAYYHAEQGDFESALSEARAARGAGIDGLIFGTGASECRDYSAVLTVLIAKGDFVGARNACSDYDNQCAVVSNGRFCFSYTLSDLENAQADTQLASSLTDGAREALHFRWLMIRDDYEGRPLTRPIY